MTLSGEPALSVTSAHRRHINNMAAYVLQLVGACTKLRTLARMCGGARICDPRPASPARICDPCSATPAADLAATGPHLVKLRACASPGLKFWVLGFRIWV